MTHSFWHCANGEKLHVVVLNSLLIHQLSHSSASSLVLKQMVSVAASLSKKKKKNTPKL